MKRATELAILVIGRLFLTALTTKASSPDAWKKHYQEVTDSCLKVSGLRNAKAVGQIVGFGDNVGYDALLVGGNYPQPHMNNQVGQVLCLFNRRTRQAHTQEANDLISVSQNRYQSDRFGFRFEYPIGYVNDAKTLPKGNPAEAIEIWTQATYDAIKSGKPSELPPNVSVTAEQNPQKLALRTWVAKSNRFPSPNNFREVTIAGQKALAFQSTGLYESENVVVPIPNRAAVIVISLDKDGLPDTDKTYRSAFQQIISTLQFINP